MKNHLIMKERENGKEKEEARIGLEVMKWKRHLLFFVCFFVMYNLKG